MSADNKVINNLSNDLFSRVASILEQTRSNAVRAINSQMIIAYWHIGREIVQEMQGGEDRAKYGKQVIDQLSEQMTERYGQGFSVANLKNFRQFFTIYSDRISSNGYPVGSEFENEFSRQNICSICRLKKS